jgi:hypothetical protein
LGIGQFSEILERNYHHTYPKAGERSQRSIKLSPYCSYQLYNNRLVWFLESQNLLADIQCGFRSQRSTLDHLIKLESFIRDAFINNEHAVSIFFDLEKAYDTTWRYGFYETFIVWD